jgi:hypothetical protein
MDQNGGAVVSAIIQGVVQIFGVALGGLIVLYSQSKQWTREREAKKADRQAETLMKIQARMIKMIDKTGRYISQGERPRPTRLNEEIYNLNNELWMLATRLKDEELIQQISELNRTCSLYCQNDIEWKDARLDLEGRYFKIADRIRARLRESL